MPPVVLSFSDLAAITCSRIKVSRVVGACGTSTAMELLFEAWNVEKVRGSFVRSGGKMPTAWSEAAVSSESESRERTPPITTLRWWCHTAEVGMSGAETGSRGGRWESPARAATASGL